MKISACLGFRNWNLDHLDRCLCSLNAFGLDVHLVDLGSDLDVRWRVQQTAASSPFVRVSSLNAEEWSRSCALNHAARQVSKNTTHFLFTDADMLFPITWRAVADVALTRDSSALWLTRSRDLPEGFESLVADQSWWRWGSYTVANLRRVTTEHPDTGEGAGMLVPRTWFERTGGFDETYKVWGVEDTDLVWRARQDGLTVQWLPDVFVAHQWHPRDWPTPSQRAVIVQNRLHFAEKKIAAEKKGTTSG